MSQIFKNMFIVMLFSSVLFVGCRPPVTDSDEDSAQENISSEKDCDDWLDSAFDMLGPDRLIITASPDMPVSLLNQWTQSCVDHDQIQLTLKKEQLKDILDGEILERTLDPRFDTVDAMHIRDNLLYKEIAENVAGYKSAEIDQVVALFDFVVRNIALREVEEAVIPLTAFRVMMFGRGSVEDRIWLFSNLVRQLKFDTVLISLSTDVSNGNKKTYLVGVILNSGVHLFDPLLGIPIPGKMDNPEKDILVTKPATLTEVVTNPELLTALDISKDELYPFTADILKKPHVQVIGDSSFYSDRMKALQFSLGGSHSVIMADSLVNNDAGDGLLTRVGEAGHDFWKKEDLKNWNYYEKQNLAAYKLDEKQIKYLAALRAPFKAPVIFDEPYKRDRPSFNDKDVESTSKKNLKGRIKFTQDLLKCRIKQMTGKLPTAIKMYQNIQLVAKKENQKPEVSANQTLVQMNMIAIQDGIFWRGICSYELEDYETALARYLQYMQLTQVRGKWSTQCRILVSQTIAQLGKPEQTEKLLANPSKKSIYYPSASFWYKRWNKKSIEASLNKKKGLDKKKGDSNGKKDPKPEEDKTKKKPTEQDKKPEVKKETKPKEESSEKSDEKPKEEKVKTEEKSPEKSKNDSKSKEDKTQEPSSEKKKSTPDKSAEGKDKPEVEEKKSEDKASDKKE
jgi:hypothetical protein